MTVEAGAETTGDYPRGRGGQFGRGNPGRPKGARNKVLVTLDAIANANPEEIATTLRTMALSGDVPAMKLLLDRMWPAPKGRVVTFDMPPIESAADVIKA